LAYLTKNAAAPISAVMLCMAHSGLQKRASASITKMLFDVPLCFKIVGRMETSPMRWWP